MAQSSQPEGFDLVKMMVDNVPPNQREHSLLQGRMTDASALSYQQDKQGVSNNIHSSDGECLSPGHGETDINANLLPSQNEHEKLIEFTDTASTSMPSTPLSSCFDNDITPVTCSPVWVRSTSCTCTTTNSMRTSPAGTGHSLTPLTEAGTGHLSALPSTLITQSGPLRNLISNGNSVVSAAVSTFPTTSTELGLGTQQVTAPLASISELRHIDCSPSPPKPTTDGTDARSGASSRCSEGRPRACISLQHLFDIEAGMEAAVRSSSGYQLSSDAGIACDVGTGSVNPVTSDAGITCDVGTGYVNPVTVFADEIERKSEVLSLMSYDASPRKPECKLQGGGAFASPSATSFSTVVSEGPICRICHEGEQGSHLISPCRCTGTLRYLHKKCLEQWLQTRNKDACELCNSEICTRRRNQPLLEWFRHPLNPRDRRNFTVDFTCGIVLTPLVVISAWLCLNGAAHYISHDMVSLEGIGLVFLAGVLIAIFSTWTLLTTRYHIMVWREWSKRNQLVTVLTATSAEQSNSQHSSPNRTYESLSTSNGQESRDMLSSSSSSSQGASQVEGAKLTTVFRV